MKPGEHIKAKLREKEWTQEDLATILGRQQSSINQIISGKVSVTPETALQLSAALGESPEFWLDVDSKYRLSLLEASPDHIAKRAKLFEMVPVNALRKRGWISDSKDDAELESNIVSFLGSDEISAAWRKADSSPLTPEQRAWACQLKRLAIRQHHVNEYSPERLEESITRLRKLAAHSPSVEKVPGVLANAGIRFVIIEPFAGSKIDGATMWLDNAPVVGLSVRLDRIDNFWFTLFHELSHVRHRDSFSLDSDTLGSDIELVVKPSVERRADAEAAESLIPAVELDSFVRRYGPMYSKTCIVQFANRLSIHPGIVVGQLQRRSEIGWNANREMLVKIRGFVTGVAMTDGWGQ